MNHAAYELRDGVLYRANKETWWAECPKDGRTVPATESDDNWGDVPTAGRFRQVICSQCGGEAPQKIIRLVPTGSVSRTRCDRRCLDARGDECNCGVCLGRDHGAGICTCGKATA